MDAPRPTSDHAHHFVRLPDGQWGCETCGNLLLGDAPRPTSDRYGCTAGCRADAGAGLHNPDCRVPPLVVPTSELAADARRALDEWYTGEPGPDKVVMYAENLIGEVHALVARVTDLEAECARRSDEILAYHNAKAAAEAQVAAWLAWSGGNYPDDSVGDVIAAGTDGTITLDDGVTTWNPLRAIAYLEARWKIVKTEAEAQVAALTSARDECERQFQAKCAEVIAEMNRAEAAEAQLATTRQALTFYAELGPHDIPYADTVNDPPDIGRVARRALAATEPK